MLYNVFFYKCTKSSEQCFSFLTYQKMYANDMARKCLFFFFSNFHYSGVDDSKLLKDERRKEVLMSMESDEKNAGFLIVHRLEIDIPKRKIAEKVHIMSE